MNKQQQKLVDQYVDEACDLLQDHCAGLMYGCVRDEDMAIEYWERVAEWAAAAARELRDEREQG